jgi:hypothetical protein
MSKSRDQKHPTVATTDAARAARAEVERLNTAELGFALAASAKVAEVSEERTHRGDRLLAAADPTTAAQDSGRRVAQLLEEQAAMEDASQRARELRIAAIPLVWKAEADDKEQQASELLAQAAALEAKSNELREALERETDWGWVPAQGNVDGQYFAIVPRSNGEARVVDARGPRHSRLRTQAAGLQSEAVQLRVREVHQAGMVEADTDDQLLTAVHSDPWRVGPPAASIIAWSAQAGDKERRRRARIQSSGSNFIPVDASITLHLEWRAGAIDVGQSGVIQPEPAPMGESETDIYRREDAERVRARNEKYRNAEPRLSTPSGPGDTGPTAFEIAREAELTGKSIKEVEAELAGKLPAKAV